ncbi:MAG: ArsR/SmtB family transcription factor [Planctomycetota bacterium]
MDESEQARYEGRAEILKALGHPARLMMVDEMSKGERCVCELTELVGLDMSTVSRHLSTLRDAGLVDSEKRGLKVFYRLSCPCILNFFTCVETVREEKERRERMATGE